MIDLSGAGYEPKGTFSINGAMVEPPCPLRTLLRAASLASDAHLVRESDQAWNIKGDPTEGALIVAAAKAGLIKADLDAKFPRVSEIPFTSESKRMTTLHATASGTVAYAKGAPEIILNACARVERDNGAASLDA